MKKQYIFLLVLLLNQFLSKAQLISGTLLPGTAANSVTLGLRSSAAFSDKFTNVQFVLQIPNTVVPAPTVSIKNNPLSAYIASYNLNSVTSATPGYFINENGYYNYLFAAVLVDPARPAYNFPADQATFNALELEITGAAVALSTVRFAHLPDGGSSLQHNFYMETTTGDHTNEAAMFYGTGASNGGSYATASYVGYPGVLPVVYKSQQLTCKPGSVQVKWTTVSEYENKLFQLQSSNDGIRWNTIAEVPGKGNSADEQQYSYEINAALAEKFYRVAQVDITGRTAYSKYLSNSCKVNGTQLLQIYPNPAKDQLKVSVYRQSGGVVSIEIYGIDGRQVCKKEVSTSEGINILPVKLAGLSSGTYVLVLRENSQADQMRFVIQ